MFAKRVTRSASRANAAPPVNAPAAAPVAPNAEPSNVNDTTQAIRTRSGRILGQITATAKKLAGARRGRKTTQAEEVSPGAQESNAIAQSSNHPVAADLVPAPAPNKRGRKATVTQGLSKDNPSQSTNDGPPRAPAPTPVPTRVTRKRATRITAVMGETDNGTTKKTTAAEPSAAGPSATQVAATPATRKRAASTRRTKTARGRATKGKGKATVLEPEPVPDELPATGSSRRAAISSLVSRAADAADVAIADSSNPNPSIASKSEQQAPAISSKNVTAPKKLEDFDALIQSVENINNTVLSDEVLQRRERVPFRSRFPIPGYARTQIRVLNLLQPAMDLLKQYLDAQDPHSDAVSEAETEDAGDEDRTADDESLEPSVISDEPNFDPIVFPELLDQERDTPRLHPVPGAQILTRQYACVFDKDGVPQPTARWEPDVVPVPIGDLVAKTLKSQTSAPYPSTWHGPMFDEPAAEEPAPSTSADAHDPHPSDARRGRLRRHNAIDLGHPEDAPSKDSQPSSSGEHSRERAVAMARKYGLKPLRRGSAAVPPPEWVHPLRDDAPNSATGDAESTAVVDGASEDHNGAVERAHKHDLQPLRRHNALLIERCEPTEDHPTPVPSTSETQVEEDHRTPLDLITKRVPLRRYPVEFFDLESNSDGDSPGLTEEQSGSSFDPSFDLELSPNRPIVRPGYELSRKHAFFFDEFGYPLPTPNGTEESLLNPELVPGGEDESDAAGAPVPIGRITAQSLRKMDRDDLTALADRLIPLASTQTQTQVQSEKKIGPSARGNGGIMAALSRQSSKSRFGALTAPRKGKSIAFSRQGSQADMRGAPAPQPAPVDKGKGRAVEPPLAEPGALSEMPDKGRKRARESDFDDLDSDTTDAGTDAVDLLAQPSTSTRTSVLWGYTHVQGPFRVDVSMVPLPYLLAAKRRKVSKSGDRAAVPVTFDYPAERASVPSAKQPGTRTRRPSLPAVAAVPDRGALTDAARVKRTREEFEDDLVSHTVTLDEDAPPTKKARTTDSRR